MRPRLIIKSEKQAGRAWAQRQYQIIRIAHTRPWVQYSALQINKCFWINTEKYSFWDNGERRDKHEMFERWENPEAGATMGGDD